MRVFAGIEEAAIPFGLEFLKLENERERNVGGIMRTKRSLQKTPQWNVFYDVEEEEFQQNALANITRLKERRNVDMVMKIAGIESRLRGELENDQRKEFRVVGSGATTGSLKGVFGSASKENSASKEKKGFGPSIALKTDMSFGSEGD